MKHTNKQSSPPPHPTRKKKGKKQFSPSPPSPPPRPKSPPKLSWALDKLQVDIACNSIEFQKILRSLAVAHGFRERDFEYQKPNDLTPACMIAMAKYLDSYLMKPPVLKQSLVGQLDRIISAHGLWAKKELKQGSKKAASVMKKVIDDLESVEYWLKKTKKAQDGRARAEAQIPVRMGLGGEKRKRFLEEDDDEFEGLGKRARQ